MKRRFSKKPEPVTARQQLQYVRQQENESLEDLAHTVYVLALDGYEKCEDDGQSLYSLLQACLSLHMTVFLFLRVSTFCI
jgi:hypothetical protein